MYDALEEGLRDSPPSPVDDPADEEGSPIQFTFREGGRRKLLDFEVFYSGCVEPVKIVTAVLPLFAPRR